MFSTSSPTSLTSRRRRSTSSISSPKRYGSCSTALTLSTRSSRSWLRSWSVCSSSLRASRSSGLFADEAEERMRRYDLNRGRDVLRAARTSLLHWSMVPRLPRESSYAWTWRKGSSSFGEAIIVLRGDAVSPSENNREAERAWWSLDCDV